MNRLPSDYDEQVAAETAELEAQAEFARRQDDAVDEARREVSQAVHDRRGSFVSRQADEVLVYTVRRLVALEARVEELEQAHPKLRSRS